VLPEGITACLFDLDGVLTNTAEVHARAWKQTFEAHEYDFDARADYDRYVDGKSREDGIRDFLASRDVYPSEAEIAQLGDEKNGLVLKLIHESGVEEFPDARRLLESLEMPCAVVSSSHNAAEVLESTGLDRFFETIVDGNVKDEMDLRGKPAPDMFLEGAKRLGVTADQAAVFEDAQAGVAAGRAGKFGHVVGVNRADQREALLEHGADVVVDELTELL
jgi:beta-phosphoglucomutase family hydrolase